MCFLGNLSAIYFDSLFRGKSPNMDHWQQDFEWKKTLDEIHKEQCVLIVGPDLIHYDNDRSLFQQFCEALKNHPDLSKDINWSAPYIFENEELLQIGENGSLGLIQNFMEDFYKSRDEFEAPFQKIAQLPFHLIISLLPDQRLAEVFHRENRKPQFGYYPLQQHWEKVTKPTQKNPLIYNMLGLVKDRKGDTITTFDNLFDFLKRILSGKALPPQLEVTLSHSVSFLFLGVHFDKWYIQLLLKVFMSYQKTAQGKRPVNYSLLRSDQLNDATGFIARRLTISPISVEPLDFLDELHRRCAEAGMLKIVPKRYEKQVFISYSHEDKAHMEHIKGQLEQANIKVIIDEKDMSAGERISRFMERVKEVDKVVLILSQHSLRSRYVGKEIMLAAEHHTPIVACHTDQEIWALDYVGKTHTYIDENLDAIEKVRIARKEKNKGDKVEDLRVDEDLWIDLKENVGKMVGNLKQEKSLSIQPADLKKNCAELIKNILT